MSVQEFLSLCTFGLLLNTVATNQGDHCIVALDGYLAPTWAAVAIGNLALIETFACDQMEERLQGTLAPALVEYFTGGFS